jgi:hypothetical protein
MDKKQKDKHILKLWKKTFIKAKAGANVLQFSNDLRRKIYITGLTRGIDEIKN